MDPDLHRAGKTQEPRKRMWMPQLQDPLRASDQQNSPETKTEGKPLVFLDEQASPAWILSHPVAVLPRSCHIQRQEHQVHVHLTLLSRGRSTAGTTQ